MDRKLPVTELTELIRVVAWSKDEFKPSEFMLRKGENGLSLFARMEKPSPAEAIETVRLMGKRGDLIAVSLKTSDIRKMGLTLVQTPGGTGNEEVNAIHFELRLPFFRRLWVRLRRIPVHEYFNESYSHKLFCAARVLT
jgi:hypothetical protein